jgi:hypothetical protein
MKGLEGSVGQNGDNLQSDVRFVQQLLNGKVPASTEQLSFSVR